MEDNRCHGNSTNQAIQELRFTKEDRNKVFAKIHNAEQEVTPQKKKLFSFSTLAPLTVSLFMVGLCIVLFVPSLLQGNVSTEHPGNTMTNSEGLNGAASQNDKNVTVSLFTVKDEENRVPINVLLSYNKDKKAMKVLSIPRDTYAPIVDKDGTTSYDKMTFAYVDGSGGVESVKTTVSEFFDLPIDYYSMMDIDTFSTVIESVNGIDYDLQEDIQVRAFSQVAFDFPKGKNHLNGEKVLALLMDATVERSLGKGALLLLISDMIFNKSKEIPQTALEQLATKTEGNISFDQIVGDELDIQSIEVVSLTEGMKNDMMDEKYYITFDKNFINSISKELTTFD